MDNCGLKIVDVDEDHSESSPWLNAVESHVKQQEHQQKDLSSINLCPFHINQRCKFKQACKLIHGEQCPHCLKNCLHPYRFEEQSLHLQQCSNADRTTEQLPIECGICLENIAETVDGRFGLLNCNHPFCLSCIKNWRTQNESVERQQSNLSTQIVRSCPICRAITHFVTPSLEWPSSGERKDEIIQQYKQRLGQIDCKHFKFGNGECPFGSSCFYAHRDRMGTNLQNSAVFARTTVAGDGTIQPVPHLQLNEFIDLDLFPQS